MVVDDAIENDIDMILFSERSPLETKNQVEDILSATTHVITKMKETKT